MQDPSDPRTAESKVIGIEHIPELVEWSVKNLRRDGLGKALDEGSIKVITGDGRKGACCVLRVARRGWETRARLTWMHGVSTLSLNDRSA